MKLFLKDLIVFGLVLCASLVLWNTFMGITALDIQLHDTYFVFDASAWTFLVGGITTLLYFLALGIRRKFSTTGANIGLIAGLLAFSFILFNFLRILLSVVSGYAPAIIVGTLLIASLFFTIILIRKTYNLLKGQ